MSWIKTLNGKILLERMKDTPINECIGFQHREDKKWKYELLKCCLVNAPMYPEHKKLLPCFRDGKCIWKGV